VPGTSGVRWLIDPLDGTVNYVHGYPMYAASIGIEVDGEPVAGAIVDSVRDVAYTARRGGGARRDGEPIRPSEMTDLSRCLIATGFSYAASRRAEQAGVVTHLLPRVADIRRGGSAALDLAAVAAGNVDAFYEIDLNPWDLAAGEVLVREAGGRVEELALDGSDDPLVLAAPEQLFERIRELLKEGGVRFAS
jgi:myo-inositol-1(or 4)-monophosphatase